MTSLFKCLLVILVKIKARNKEKQLEFDTNAVSKTVRDGVFNGFNSIRSILILNMRLRAENTNWF